MENGRHIDLMGIVNLTDDSFYSGSRCSRVSEAMDRISLMVEEGADIIDLGACSTRPGSLPVGPDEEWVRLRPVLQEISSSFPSVRISIDTYWSDVVRKSYGLIGDFIVNDISSGEDDPDMLPTVGRLGLDYIAMHKRGNPMTMQTLTDYDDVTSAVCSYFDSFALRAAQAGIRTWVLDPGFGFAKTLEQNYELLSGLSRLKKDYGSHTPKILVGLSRKSMIYRPLGIDPEDALSATQALHMVSLLNGADILRVHDVKEARQTIFLYRNLR